MVFRFLIPQSQKATDIISKQIMDFIERDESWSILHYLLQQTIRLKTRFSTTLHNTNNKKFVNVML